MASDAWEDSKNVVAVDAGSLSAYDAGMDELTTSADRGPDEGVVDIGFHNPSQYECVDLRATDLFGTVSPAREMHDGAYVHYNIDDDNASGNYLADYTETEQYVANEDDLKLLQIAASDSLTSGTVVLTRNNEAVRVWKSPQKGAGNEVLTGSPHQPDTEGNGKKTWDLSDPGERQEFNSVKGSLYVEGVQLGTALLAVTYTSGQTEVADQITYTLIAATCGLDAGVPQPGAQRRADLQRDYPGLLGCEWSVTDPKPEEGSNYDCVAWSVGRTDACLSDWSVIDDRFDEYPWGNATWIAELSDYDDFYAWHGYVVASNMNDADIILYANPPTSDWHYPDAITHAARRVGQAEPDSPTSQCQCGAGRWAMFESKLNPFRERIEHRWDQLTGGGIGYPFRYYRKQ